MSCIDGFNVALLAYGQTGSGKTWTMMGPSDNPGVNRRAIVLLLNHLKGMEGELNFQIDASQIEVYNEGVYDLLSTAPRADTKIKPRQLPTGVELPNLTWRSVKTDEDMYQVMIDGDKHRTTMATAMNSASSRSHLLFQVRIRTENKISGAKTDSTMVLVDLAGSERVAKSEVTGDGMKEAAAINQSLSALGQVFGALAKKDPHVPYRNSVLTHVLANSLGGNSKTCMFAACSPLESNLPETISTLKFATNISKIELGKAKSSKKS